jgi:hypothetical protein
VPFSPLADEAPPEIAQLLAAGRLLERRRATGRRAALPGLWLLRRASMANVEATWFYEKLADADGVSHHDRPLGHATSFADASCILATERFLAARSGREAHGCVSSSLRQPARRNDAPSAELADEQGQRSA